VSTFIAGAVGFFAGTALAVGTVVTVVSSQSDEPQPLETSVVSYDSTN
jgi:hypothetical protein